MKWAILHKEVSTAIELSPGKLAGDKHYKCIRLLDLRWRKSFLTLATDVCLDDGEAPKRCSGTNFINLFVFYFHFCWKGLECLSPKWF